MIQPIAGRVTVSAVMPNYNDAPTIGESLDALLGQSFTDLEVIVVDDGSTDDSVAVIESYARRDRRVRLMRHERNRGPVAAQLTGFAAAQGKYTFGPSANDKVLPGFLENLVAALEAAPFAAVALCDVQCMDDPDWNLVAGISSVPVALTPGDLVSTFRERSFVLGGAASLVRTSAWREAGWLLPELRWMADFFAMQVTAFRHGLCYVPQSLYSIRRPTYSHLGPRSAVHRDVTATLLELLRSDRYVDVRDEFIRSGVLSRVPGILRVLLRSPKDRDALVPALLNRCLWEETKDLVRPAIPRSLWRMPRRIAGARGLGPWSRADVSAQP